MFFVWGTKLIRKARGWVADFCPKCRAPEAFELRQVNKVQHIYYLPLGRGQLVGHERRCQHCGIVLTAQPARYVAIAPHPAPIRELITQTFPTLEQAYAPRLELEQRLRQSPASLSGAERRALILESFMLISPKVEKRYSATHFDRESALTLLGAVLAVILAIVAGRRLAPDDVAFLILAVFLAGAAALIAALATGNARYLRREVYPALGATLKPLQPTQSELDAALGELKKLGHKLGSKARMPELMAGMS